MKAVLALALLAVSAHGATLRATRRELEGCESDSEWHKKKKPEMDCDWVAGDIVSRCKKKNANKVKAEDVCCACLPGGTRAPTAVPTAEPTAEPTADPTYAPTASPTPFGTYEPTASPTPFVTYAPTGSPTMNPTVSDAPTYAPTTPLYTPSATPTEAPTTTKAPTPVCEEADDSEWHKKKKPAMDCLWVAGDPATRCKKKNDDKVQAFDGCACTCQDV